ncbi:MAG TPA: MBL fold metallo-hydrolase [Rhodanobacteraceae bacterium]|nr:MBL fold metallo-hydrolase [Rhodanobacteraceae bacterium]
MTPSVRSFHHAASGSWTHVVADPDSGAAAIVDPVLDFEPAGGRVRTDAAEGVLAYVVASGLTIEWILETHAHADHLSAAQWIKCRSGGRVGIGAGIVEVQRRFRQLLELDTGFATDGSQFDRLFLPDECVVVGDLRLRVMATPGHTCDGVSYLVGDAVFVGDTLFAPSAGTARCDFPGADAGVLYRSIRSLYQLPGSTRVFLCHDYPQAGAPPTALTSIADEKAGNVHLDENTGEADFVSRRRARDATLAVPRLLWSALQVNIRAGHLPPATAGGRRYLKVPIESDSSF